MKTWQDIGFQIEYTADGSPSLRLIQSLREDRENGEAMHHSGGAASETELIYGQLIAEAFRVLEKPHFCVVGLGLGYIEFLIARESLLAGKSFQLTSYESVPELRENFLALISGTLLGRSAEVLKTYEDILAFVVKRASFSKENIYDCLHQSYKDKNLRLAGSLEKSSVLDWKAHVYLYDAFSSKTTPHLWEEEFLIYFLSQTALPDAALATYAAKGSLKRALSGAGFHVLAKPGFMGKRNSTEGRRGIFNVETSLHTPQ